MRDEWFRREGRRVQARKRGLRRDNERV